MPELSAQSPARRRRRRADAEQSVAAILAAAVDVLNADPGASVEDIARAAGVSRQTVYAHFPSRQAMLDAVVERATGEAVAAFDAARLGDAPPAEALISFLEAGWKATAQTPFIWHLPPVSPGEDLDRHRPIVELLTDIIKRGQDSGDFDRTTSPDWLITAALALGRAATDEVQAGRMSIDEATSAMHHSFLRLFGIEDSG